MQESGEKLMNKLNFSFVYKKVKIKLIKNYGKEIALEIWKNAGIKFKELSSVHKKIGTDEKIMVLPLAAIYLSMKEAKIENPLSFLLQYGKETGDKLSELIRKFTSFPGVPEFLWKNINSIMRKNSSPEKGYQRRIISETKELVAVDILVCPLYEMAKKLEIPEIASVVCLIDKGQMTGFKNIDYTRTKALGNGDEYCDYRLRYNRKSD